MSHHPKKFKDQKPWSLRYRVVIKAIDREEIYTFDEILVYISRAAIAREIGVSYLALGDYLKKPAKMRMGTYQKLADLFETDLYHMIGLILREPAPKQPPDIDTKKLTL